MSNEDYDDDFGTSSVPERKELPKPKPLMDTKNTNRKWLINENYLPNNTNNVRVNIDRVVRLLLRFVGLGSIVTLGIFLAQFMIGIYS